LNLKAELLLGISMGSENDRTVNAKIGLAKRYDLKGIAIWRLGIIGQAVWTQMNESIKFK
jgi:spore germination protein YaaH